MTMQHFSILPAIAILYSILLLYYHPIFTYALSSNRRIRGETLHDIRWKRQFEAWKGLLSDSDNSSVRKVSRRGHPDLYKWVYRQKKCFRSGTLKGQRLQLLMESGFFDIEVDGDQEERSFDDNYGVKSWDEMFVKLIEYKENHTELEFLELWCNGDIILQNDHDCTDFVEWVEEQSKSYRKLSAARIDKLSATGIELNLTKARWQRMYLKLREFRNTQGHCNVSCDDDENLSIWVNSQRRLYRKRLRGDSKCLSDERFGLLKEIGIHHHHNENYMQWEDYYLQLFDIVEQNNDPNGIETYLRESKSNPKLLRWIYAQRGYYRKKCNGEDTPLTDDRLKRLIELDFNFDTRKSWDDRYDELCEYVAQNGHFNISRKDNYGLSQWIYYQKRDYARHVKGEDSTITTERIHLLENVGFDFSCDFHSDWREKYEELCIFKEIHGHCNVPQRYNENLSLGLFVYNCRMQFKNLLAGEWSSLTEERLDELERIGFCFDNQQHRWFTKLEDLKKYKELHGNCDVPRQYKEDLGLAWWVQYNRQAYKEFKDGRPSSITPLRIKLLEDIGFHWVAPRVSAGPTVQDWANLFQVMRDKLAEPDGTKNFVERLDVMDRWRPVTKVDVDSLWYEEEDDENI